MVVIQVDFQVESVSVFSQYIKLCTLHFAFNHRQIWVAHDDDGLHLDGLDYITKSIRQPRGDAIFLSGFRRLHSSGQRQP